jgi:hypothetical protein
MSLENQRPIERCGKCGRQRESGDVWHVFEGVPEMVIDIPIADSLLPFDVVEAIREHDGIVKLTPLPEAEIPAVLEVSNAYLGTVCPTCYEDFDWDFHQWAMYLAERRTRPGSELEEDA